MEEIYRNSSANISATDAARGADGLFFERNPLVIDPCRKTFVTPDDLHLYVDMIPVTSGQWDKYVDGASIHTRGWVYQERILAPRIIHFAQDQVYWECCTMERSEASMICADQGRGFDRIVTKVKLMTLTSDPGYCIWKWTVEKYTNLFLSYPRDRLLAISAIAQHFCMRIGLQAEDYLAGCWRADFPHFLSWVCDKYRLNSGNYIAPSCSWASVGGRIKYIESRSGECFSPVEIIGASIIPTRVDPFGEILSGYIRAACSLSQVLWRPRREKTRNHH